MKDKVASAIYSIFQKIVKTKVHNSDPLLIRSEIKKGVFVISLDFELYWGVRDTKPLEKYRKSLLRVKEEVIPALLKMFAEYGIHATWAVVGFLFFENRDELIRALPDVKPNYDKVGLSPYDHIHQIGQNEQEAPFHFAPSLIKLIQSYADQEIASHTFSHHYCLEAGQNITSFTSDLEAFGSIARKFNVIVQTLVFPRNQINLAYRSVCRECGIKIYRVNPSNFIHKLNNPKLVPLRRFLRLLDAYINLTGHNCCQPIPQERDLPFEFRSSRPLRPYSHRFWVLEPLRLRRIKSDLSYAASKSLVYHLWWHPHNFGVNPKENLSFLRRILEHYAGLRDKGMMESLSMGEVAERAEKDSR